MSTTSADRLFAGSVPEFYDTYMVPLIFEPYARDVAKRLGRWRLSRVLEVAAGTGVVTRALAAALRETTAITATDLNPAMLERARAVGTARPVEWGQADAMQLPFGDATFDAVVCQFGAMFFPDRARAFAEARRVLRPGGVYLFSVWDRIEDNDFADVIMAVLATMFPDDPPRFMVRTPHGYHDPRQIARDLASGGFTTPPEIEIVAARSRAPTPRAPAVAYCEGTPWRNEIESRDPARLAEATNRAEEALTKRFGPGPIDGKIQALVVTARVGE
jgi:SAM-dependent methyltransferase